MVDAETLKWWRSAVIYQIYPRSWADANGDGIGDLPGITARLDHLVELGVDAIWLSPFYTSPMNDAGYDVADYRDVDPRFGTLADYDELEKRAHALGLKVVVDLVPNHSSSEHAWFKAALAAAPGSPERARYMFREGRGEHGELPPNNWVGSFGGSAWSRVTEADGNPGQWYLHLFDRTQPDYDWTNEEVREEFRSILRFWLDRGVDGFRIDVAHGLVKKPDLPDRDPAFRQYIDPTGLEPMWDQPGVHEIYRDWRRIVQEYAKPGEDADRILCAEAWVVPEDALAQYVRPDELHQSFNFAHTTTPWHAADQQRSITESLAAVEGVGAPQTWVLSNHDIVRHASRLGFDFPAGEPYFMDGIGADDPQPDAVVGLRRARAATAVILALPGSVYLYQGEEFGLPEHTTMPDDVRQDPTWESSGHERRGRDGCRVPIAWEADAPAFGFNTTGESWLPQPASYGPLAADQQRGVEGSTLEFYRATLALRRKLSPGTGTLTWLDLGPDMLGFTVTSGSGTVTVVTNFGTAPVTLPAGDVLVSSGDLTADGRLPTDTTVWLG